MGTIERLDNYKRALEKWVAKKRRYDLSVAAGKPEKKQPESEPMPKQFEISDSEMEWAEKIRCQVTKPKPIMPKLDEQLPKIKMPERKTI